MLYVNEDYEEALKNYTQAISLQDVFVCVGKVKGTKRYIGVF